MALGLSHEETLKRYLYTCSYYGAFITGNPDKHFGNSTGRLTFRWAKTAPEEFVKIITTVSEDALLVRRSNFFYLLAEGLLDKEVPSELKAEIKKLVFKLIKTDQDFFDFIKFYTTLRTNKPKISTTLRKMIIKFYQNKEPKEFAETVARQESYHGWTHKDLIKLTHFKCNNVACEPIMKYVLYGIDQLPEGSDETSKSIIEYLKKSHELRTTEDVAKATSLIKELHVTVDRVNSKLNKTEEVWLAAIPEMTTREVLQCLYRFYKFGFFKAGSQFQAKICEALSDAEKIKKCNLHPVEVFIYLKFFEKGGKTMDPKLLEYLQKKEIREETLKRLTTPSEPKCKPVFQSINKCLKLSYDNVQPTGKRYMVTIDVTEKTETVCFHNKRIPCLEAAVAIIRFLSKVERNVTVAVFKDSQINFVDISKSHSAVDKLFEHKSAYISPSAPLDWARNKKKQIDVFINFMSSNWQANVPPEIKEKMEKVTEALSKYSKKMQSPETRLVKIYLDGAGGAFGENTKNILSIAGFSVDVPKVLEAFCRGRFC
ncbi:RNA-binding protein RO60 isoform X2 [Tribolium castaneum]|uniref:60 kDa SS-A/Ro ribonucleoprotein-like Protein n=2 Tax=Tribolium castaneum TaxID=7070 RepID=D6X3X8_TRICA|nr:PREDICTED: 60 kDa SS-A/Ro ribonucleoprotein isoform X2 [Tribolium castaneum]EEZ97483.1 60 kDa SS-A/Ro ribonucleoprotein-like Protein [Tribolium castaneum]|eukprot:XP_008198649.1 PREDICTED: 60 kDa SS-A/Ro ribonucleoprotein isoform X2 [Tribolium castaneum]